jgi:hypothetical protein
MPDEMKAGAELKTISEEDAIELGLLCLKAGIDVIPDSTLHDEMIFDADNKPMHRVKIAALKAKEK